MAQIDITPIPNETNKLSYNLLDGKLTTAPPSPMSYPLDLTNYGHAIKFSIWEYDFGSISNYFNNISGSIMNVQQNGLSWDSLFGGISNVLDLFRSSSYLGGASGTRQGVKLPPKEIIHLYMPDTLQTSYDSDYSTISLTSAFGLAGYLMNAISDSKMPKSFSEMKSKDIDISQMLNSDFGKFVEANIAGGVAGRFGGNSQDVTALMLQAMKMTPNPQLQLIYKNVGLREFQFSFIFTPSSQKEAEVVDKIINRFNHYSLPQLNNNTSGFSQYLTPPQIFTIEFVPLLGGESKIFNIGDCVLTNIAVDYAPSGWSIYQDNHPVETRMNLMFREMNMRTKADEPLI